jgi:hypothetical protein
MRETAKFRKIEDKKGLPLQIFDDWRIYTGPRDGRRRRATDDSTVRGEFRFDHLYPGGVPQQDD